MVGIGVKAMMAIRPSLYSPNMVSAPGRKGLTIGAAKQMISHGFLPGLVPGTTDNCSLVSGFERLELAGKARLFRTSGSSVDKVGSTTSPFVSSTSTVPSPFGKADLST